VHLCCRNTHARRNLLANPDKGKRVIDGTFVTNA
jgi:hypothetical protein